MRSRVLQMSQSHCVSCQPESIVSCLVRNSIEGCQKAGVMTVILEAMCACFQSKNGIVSSCRNR